jgi:hypothetical protein
MYLASTARPNRLHLYLDYLYLGFPTRAGTWEKKGWKKGQKRPQSSKNIGRLGDLITVSKNISNTKLGLSTPNYGLFNREHDD